MALVLIPACWLLLVSLVIGACAAARRGDRQLRRGAPTRAPGDAGERLARSHETRRARALSRSRAGASTSLKRSSLPSRNALRLIAQRGPSHDPPRHRATWS